MENFILCVVQPYESLARNGSTKFPCLLYVPSRQFGITCFGLHCKITLIT